MKKDKFSVATSQIKAKTKSFTTFCAISPLSKLAMSVSPEIHSQEAKN